MLLALQGRAMERWFTDAFKPRRPGRWQKLRDTVAATGTAGYLGCSAALVPAGRYGEIANAKHFPNVGQDGIFNRRMLGWFNAQRKS